jgi:hypothetical protein
LFSAENPKLGFDLSEFFGPGFAQPSMEQSMMSAEDQALPPPKSSPLRSQRERFALTIDRYSALLFPALFALFNVFYWFHYLTE